MEAACLHLGPKPSTTLEHQTSLEAQMLLPLAATSTAAAEQYSWTVLVACLRMDALQRAHPWACLS